MSSKEKILTHYIQNCPEIIETLNACNSYGLKNYYLADGAITQLIWNNLLGLPKLEKVKDFDIIYFEEDRNGIEHQENLSQLVSHNMPLDIVNQAYVHEWYHKKFGNKIEKFNCAEDGIKTWLSAFAVGIRKTDDFKIYAPYGLEDTFNFMVRPNKLTMSKSNYLTMTKSFKQRWENITVLPWD